MIIYHCDVKTLPFNMILLYKTLMYHFCLYTWMWLLLNNFLFSQKELIIFKHRFPQFISESWMGTVSDPIIQVYKAFVNINLWANWSSNQQKDLYKRYSARDGTKRQCKSARIYLHGHKMRCPVLLEKCSILCVLICSQN